MSGWLLIGIIWAGLYLYWRLALLVGAFFKAGSGCSCRKHAWDPRCPVHGRDA